MSVQWRSGYDLISNQEQIKGFPLKNLQITKHASNRLNKRNIDVKKAFEEVIIVRTHSLSDVIRWREKHGSSNASPPNLCPIIVYEGEYSSSKEPCGFVRYRLIVGDKKPQAILITAYRIEASRLAV